MNEAAVNIRPLTSEDVAACHRIDESVSTHPWPKSTLSRGLRPNHIGEVVEVNGHVVGFCISLVIADELSVLNVAVAAAFQRQGMGRRLLKSALSQGQHMGVTEAFLEVRQSNHAAQTLYEGLGFHVAGIRENYYPGIGTGESEHALVMAKTLLDDD